MPALGFGTMRMMHRTHELGVNYFDTACGYHYGWSEVVARKGLKALPRGRITITTKLLLWLWDQPKVSLVLSGMERLEQNAAIAGRARTNTLTAVQQHAINQVRAADRR